MRNATVAARTLSSVTKLVARGRAPDLLRSADCAPGMLDDPTSRVSRDLAVAIWEKADRTLGGPRVGLYAARALPFGALGIQEYVLRNGATLGQGLREVARLGRLLYDAHTLALEVEDGAARMVHHVHGAPPPEQPSELLLARIAVLAERVTGARLPVRRIDFAHDAPRDTEEHRRFFRAPVRFGRGVSEIVFDAAALELPVPGADPELAALLAAHADRLLAEVRAPPDELGTRVRFHLAASLSRGIPSLDAAARELRTSARSLQRGLAEAGTSYRALVDEVRREQALRGVGDPRASLGALALDLGFADAPAFHRAFRRWTGTTPGALRRSRRCRVT